MASGSCGASVTWNLNESTGALTLSGSGATYSYDSSNNPPWISYRTSIKTVTVGDGITSLGQGIFNTVAHNALTTVVLGKDVSSIGQAAFRLASKITSITFNSTSAPSMTGAPFMLTNSGTVNVTVYTRGGWGSNSVFTDAIRGVSSSASTIFSYVGIYDVTFNSNGGSSTPSAQTVTSGSTITLPSVSRTGYTFNGWYTASSGGTRVGGAGNSYTVTSNVTLYAQWSQITYTVTYNANGGSVSPTSATVNYNSSVTLPTPTHMGGTFNGWYTAKSGGTRVGGAGDSYTPTSSLTLYAQWAIDSGIPMTTKDPIQLNLILDRMESIANTYYQQAIAKLTAIGGTYTMSGKRVTSYTVPAKTLSKTFRGTYPGAANHTGNSVTNVTHTCTVTIPAATYTSVSNESPSDVIASFREKFNSEKVHSKVTHSSIAALFIAFATSLSWAVTKHNNVDEIIGPGISVTSDNSTKAAQGKNYAANIDFNKTIETASDWTNAMSYAAALAGSFAAPRISDDYTRATASWSCSSCSSSSSSSCCSSSSSSSCSSSSCSCWFIAFYDVGGI